jgi:hypothetical protein
METKEIKLDEAQVARTAEIVATEAEKLGLRMDAEESIFFARQLEHMLAKEFEVKYPDRKARLLIPISGEVDPGAESYTYPVYDRLGLSKIISDYSADLPTFDALAREVTAKIVSHGGSFKYSVQELRSAVMAKKPIEERKRRAAVAGMSDTENRLLLLGDSTFNIAGFLKSDAANGGNVPLVSIPADGTGSSKLWSTKTAELIIRDLNLLVRTVRTQSKGVHVPTTVLLPESSHGIIASTPYSIGGGSDKTILAWWMANNPGVEIDWLNELETAGGSSLRRMMAYVRRPDMVEGHIPVPYEQFPPQAKNLSFMVPVHGRFGGVAFYYPLSACYGDGI